MDYEKYVTAFNEGNDAALVERFFTEDCIFQSRERRKSGRKELLDFLNFAHDGIREILRPQVVLRDENHIFAEIDMDFHATADRPEFVFGALKKGESTTVKFFVVYYLREGRVAQLKASFWHPNVGVTKANLRLGATLEQRQEFQNYIRAFSRADIDTFTKYYTDDVRCELSAFTIEKREGIANFYRELFKTVREDLTVHEMIADDKGIATEMTTRFTAIEDAPNFAVGGKVTPLKKGEFVVGRAFIHYALDDGRISRIRVARAGAMSEPSAATK